MLSVNEENFKQEVLDASMPVLVNFWAPWCSLCKRITPILQGFQSDWVASVKVVNINADENLRLSSTYRLTSLPTLLMFHHGKISYRLDQLIDQRDLRYLLNQVLTQQKC